MEITAKEQAMKIANEAINETQKSHELAVNAQQELRDARARILELEEEVASLSKKQLEATSVANMAELALRALAKSYKDELHTSTGDVISFVLSKSTENLERSFAELRSFAQKHENNLHLHNADVIRFINALPNTQTMAHIHEWWNKIREYCSKANSGVSQESIWLWKDENGMDVCMDKIGCKLSIPCPALFPNTELYYLHHNVYDSDEDD